MTAPARIPKAEVERAVSGAIAGGMVVARVRVDLDRRIVDIFAPGESPPEPENIWDKVLFDAAPPLAS